MTKKEILEQARRLIADENRWCSGHLAMNDRYEVVGYDSLYAVRWCAAGAMTLCGLQADEDVFLDASTALHGACRELGHASVPAANDLGGHSVIVRAFDLAIEKVQ